MDTVLSDLKPQTYPGYLGDVIVFSSTIAEHLTRLPCVLRAVRGARLTHKEEKCPFGYKNYGSRVTLSAPSASSPILTKYPASPTSRACQQKCRTAFLCLCSFYRCFIANFSHTGAVLTSLTRNDIAIVSTTEQQAS